METINISLEKEHYLVKHSFDLSLPDKYKGVEVVIDNAKDSLYKLGWVNYKPFISKDNINWRRIESAGVFDGKRFSFNVPKEFGYVSWFPPYTEEKFKDLLSSIDLNVISGAVDWDSLKTPCLSIGDIKNKDCIILLARQHPGETMSSFFIEGVIEEIILNSKNLLDDYSFLIFPFVNLEGVRSGNHRLDIEGADLNRMWNKRHPLLEDIISKISETDNKIILDIHGDEVSGKNYLIYSSYLNDDGVFYKKILEETGFLSLKEQSFIKRFVKNLFINKIIITPQGLCSCRAFLSELGWNSLTLELSAHISTPEICKALGAKLVKNLINHKKV